MTHRQRMAVYYGVLLALLLPALDQSVVATALPRISADLGGFSHLSWVFSAYLLASTATMPLYGKLSDLHGRRPMFIVAISIFLVGSFLCGLAQSVTELAIFRAFQGLGAGGVMPLAFASMGDLFSPRERGRYQAYLGMVWTVSTLSGPLIGGVLTDQLSWRWIFWINLPIGGLALAVITTQMQLPFERREHGIDYVGALTLTGAISSLLLLASWGGNTYDWGSPQIVGLGLAMTAMLGLFVISERRANEPILPFRILRIRAVALANTVTLVLGATTFCMVVYLPLFVQGVLGASATRSGIILLPFFGSWILASIGSGQVIARTGRYRILPSVGTPLILGGILLVAQLDAGSSALQVACAAGVVGTGMGLTMQPFQTALQNAVPRGELGVASASNQLARSVGGALSVAAFGTVLISRLSTELGRRSVTGIAPQTLLQAPDTVHEYSATVVQAVHEALAHALQWVFYGAVPLGVIAFGAALMVRETPLRTMSYVDLASELDVLAATRPGLEPHA